MNLVLHNRPAKSLKCAQGDHVTDNDPSWNTRKKIDPSNMSRAMRFWRWLRARFPDEKWIQVGRCLSKYRDKSRPSRCLSVILGFHVRSSYWQIWVKSVVLCVNGSIRKVTLQVRHWWARRRTESTVKFERVQSLYIGYCIQYLIHRANYIMQSVICIRKLT